LHRLSEACSGRGIARNLAVALLYWLFAYAVAKFFAAYGLFPAPTWPSAGVAWFAAAVGGPACWPGIFIGSLLANYILFTPPLPIVLGISIGNVLGPAIGLWLLRRSRHSIDPFLHFRDVIGFICYGAVIHGAIAATVGVFSLYAGAKLASGHLAAAWLRWTLSDASGVLVFAPLLQLWWRDRKWHFSRYQALHLSAIYAATLALTVYIFFGTEFGNPTPIGQAFMLIGPLLWVTVRFSEREAYPLFAIVMVIATVGTVSGYGPFHSQQVGDVMATLGFIGFSYALILLLIASLNNERSAAEDSLREANEFLEKRVVERTTELQASQQEIVASEKRTRQMVDSMPIPLMMTRHDDDVLLYINRKAEEAFGIRGANFLGNQAPNLYVNPGDQETIRELLKRKGTVQDFEIALQRLNGDPFWVMLSSVPLSFKSEQVLLTGLIDISERKRLEEDLMRQATTDPLTGIANRRYFMTLFESEFVRASRTAHPLTLLMLDIDHFKLVNDTYGHDVGDLAIKALAVICMQSIRQYDTAARIGGEEFLILLPQTGLDAAMVVAERVRSAVQRNAIALADGRQLQFTVSVGVATLNRDIGSADQLFKRSDLSLYEAKEGGRNRCVTLDR
jgi:diguanylate cyclase (GGDEF)-like protein/PAS domain S-box-containing protein